MHNFVSLLFFLPCFFAAQPAQPSKQQKQDLDPRLDTRVPGNVDFWSTNTLKSHLLNSSPLGYDALIFLYLPFDGAIDTISGMVVRVGEILDFGFTSSATSSYPTVNVFFDCVQDQEAVELCKSITRRQVPSEGELVKGRGRSDYPSLWFMRDAEIIENDGSNSNGKNKKKSMRAVARERLIRFRGNLRHGEEIRDFVIGLKMLNNMEGLGMRLAKFLLAPFRWGRSSSSQASRRRPIGLKQDWPQYRSSLPGVPSDDTNAELLRGEIAQLESTQDQLVELTTQNAIVTDALLLQWEGVDVFSVMGEKGWARSAEEDDLITTIPCVASLVMDYCGRLVYFGEKAALQRPEFAKFGNPDSEVTVAESETFLDYLNGFLIEKEPFCAKVDECFPEGSADAFFNMHEGNSECRPPTCPFKSATACGYVNTCLNEEVKNEFRREVEKIQQ